MIEERGPAADLQEAADGRVLASRGLVQRLRRGCQEGIQKMHAIELAAKVDMTWSVVEFFGGRCQFTVEALRRSA